MIYLFFMIYKHYYVLTLSHASGHDAEHHGPAARVCGEGGGGVGAVRQVQPGAGQGGPLQHHAGHLPQELQRVYPLHHPAPLLLIQGIQTHHINLKLPVMDIFTLVQHFRCTSTPIIHKHK